MVTAGFQTGLWTMRSGHVPMIIGRDGALAHKGKEQEMWAYILKMSTQFNFLQMESS